MKRKNVITALLCSVCLVMSSLTGLQTVLAEEPAETEEETNVTETPKETEAETLATQETEETEAETTVEEETEGGTEAVDVPAVRPKYHALDYVTLDQYTGLSVTVDNSLFVVDDTAIDDKIEEEIRSADALETLTEGEVQNGDVANIDFEGKLNGEAFEGGTSEGYDLEIGSGTFIEGFEEGLVGVSVGETVDLPLTFPDAYGNADLAGKDVIFTVTVNSISRVPELTDELADTISEGAYTDVDSYRAHVVEELEAEMAQQKDYYINGELYEQLLLSNTINDYPEELIKYGMDNMRNYYSAYAQAYGMELEDFISSNFNMTMEQFEDELELETQQGFRQEILLMAIAEQEGIELTEEEFEQGCEKYLKLYESTYNFGSSEEMLEMIGEEQVRLNLLQDKVMDFVRDNSTITEVTETETETESEF